MATITALAKTVSKSVARGNERLSFNNTPQQPIGVRAFYTPLRNESQGFGPFRPITSQGLGNIYGPNNSNISPSYSGFANPGADVYTATSAQTSSRTSSSGISAANSARVQQQNAGLTTLPATVLPNHIGQSSALPFGGSSPAQTSFDLTPSVPPLSFSENHFGSRPSTPSQSNAMQLTDDYGRNLPSTHSQQSNSGNRTSSTQTNTNGLSEPGSRNSAPLMSTKGHVAFGGAMLANTFVKGGMSILQQKQAQQYNTYLIDRATGYMKAHGIPWLPNSSSLSTSQNSAKNSLTAHGTTNPASFPSGPYSQVYGVGDFF